jgi:glycerol-3-phosphate acyltransferase PlsY
LDTFEIVRALLIVIAAYVIGGIPWSIIVARATGRTDPRTIGSGRTGGANAMRAMGPRLALLSGLLDMLKGTFVVLAAQWLGAGIAVAVLAGLAAIIGHSRSVFLGLGGGRGVAPAFGGLLAFAPLVALAVIPVFVGVIVVTRYSSLGSLVGSLFGGILLTWATATQGWDPWLYVYAVGGTLLVWVFHADNIGRLLAGTERRIELPSRGPATATAPSAAAPNAPEPRSPDRPGKG